MTITSMSNRELYKTLTGYDFPNSNKSNKTSNSGNAKPAETSNVQSNGEIKWIELSAEELKRITLSEDKSSIISKNIDRFVPSGNIDNSEFFKTISSDGFKVTDDIDFNDRYTQMVINDRSLIDTYNGGRGPTKESIAKYYGDMAKRLDAAYSEGKFTKDEYDYLNEGIAERMKRAADNAEKSNAFFKVSHDRSMSYKEFERTVNMTSEEQRADLKEAIDRYINQYTRIDRTSLLVMFNAIRYGK